MKSRGPPIFPAVSIRNMGNVVTIASRKASQLALEALGYEDGRNIRLEIRSSEGDLGRLPALAENGFRARPAVHRRRISRTDRAGVRGAVGAHDRGLELAAGGEGHDDLRRVRDHVARHSWTALPPEVGAARELEEELGLVPGRMEKLCEFFVSPGFLSEKMWLYLATDLQETEQRLDDDEAIEIVRMPIDRALQMITDNEIEDAKTIIGLLLAAPRIGVSPFAPDYPAV
mgnify:CR=1 FL=1